MHSTQLFQIASQLTPFAKQKGETKDKKVTKVKMIDDVFVFDVLFDDELEKYFIFYANTPNVLALMTNVANVKLVAVFFQISGREKFITIIERIVI